MKDPYPALLSILSLVAPYRRSCGVFLVGLALILMLCVFASSSDAAGERGLGTDRALLGLLRVPYLNTSENFNMLGTDLTLTETDIGRYFTLHAGRDQVAFGPIVHTGGNVPRGTIASFTDASRRRLHRYLTNSLARYEMFGTVTVADDILSPAQFKVAQNRFFVSFMRYQRETAKRIAEHNRTDIQDAIRNVSCCWFLEFQRRGAPHLHFLYTHAVDWRRAAGAWCDAIDQPWAFQTCSQFISLTNSSSIAGYALKIPSYATKALDKDKQYQKEAPKGTQWGRWWGVRGERSTVAATCALELNHCTFKSVKESADELSDRVFHAAQRGEVQVIPWKGMPRGRSVYFTPQCTNDTRGLIYMAMARLMTWGGTFEHIDGDSDDGE